MRIVVAGTFEAGSQWAYAINTVKMAEGFSKNGIRVYLICHRPDKKKTRSELEKIYGISGRVKWIFVPKRILGIKVNQHNGFGLLVLPIVLLLNPSFLYSRTALLAYYTSHLGINTIVESHSDPENTRSYFYKLLKAANKKYFRLWVTIADVLKEGYVVRGVPEAKILVIPDAVDLSLFGKITKKNALGSEGRQKIVYTGHLYDYKGIPTTLKAARLLPNFDFFFVGGWTSDINRHLMTCEALSITNVYFIGLKPHSDIPMYLNAADILLLPPSLNHPSARWTSPIKLAEYLASGKPIICSDIPALQNLVRADEVTFFKADSPESLAEKILLLMSNQEEAMKKSALGLEKVKLWSYEARAGKITTELKKLLDEY